MLALWRPLLASNACPSKLMYDVHPLRFQVQEKVGVLLLNLGGPETLDDVQPFLYNLFADPDIIRLPKAAQFLQPFIATVISSLRAPKSAEGCASTFKLWNGICNAALHRDRHLFPGRPKERRGVRFIGCWSGIL